MKEERSFAERREGMWHMALEEGSQYLEKIPERVHRELTRNILRRIWQSLRSG